MIAMICLLLLSSVSLIAALKFNLKYEYGLPISFCVTGIILYLFGYIGYLDVGYYAVLILSAIYWIYVIYSLLAHKGIRERIFRLIFSRGFSRGFREATTHI